MPHYWVSVPYANLEIAWDGEVPELTSPWGEHHPASSSPLFRGSKATLYSPFNSPDEGSAAFEAHLTSRAIESVHGISIPPEEVQERYFEVDGDRLVGLKRGGLTLTCELPPRAAATRESRDPNDANQIRSIGLQPGVLTPESRKSGSSIRVRYPTAWQPPPEEEWSEGSRPCLGPECLTAGGPRRSRPDSRTVGHPPQSPPQRRHHTVPCSG